MMKKSTVSVFAVCAALSAAVVLTGCAKGSDGEEGVASTKQALPAGTTGGADGEEAVDLTKQALVAAEAAKCDVAASKGAELHIYTWSDYIAPDVIQSFETALGCKIVVDTFDSNEAMYAKLKAGGTGYDIIMPTSYQIATMARENMIIEIDHARIPAVLANFDKSFESQILDPTFKYNVPYAVTYTGFIYAKDKIPEGAAVESWSILANPALKGRISLLDDIREVIGAGLMYLGYSINSTNPEEIDKAVDQILEWRKNVRKFDGESYKTEVASGSTFLGHGYSTDSTQVILGDEDEGTEARDDIGFALPKEGYSVAFDEMVIANGSKSVDLAYAFINYIYQPEVAAANMSYVCGPNPVAPGIALLDEDYRNLIILDEATLSRGQVIKGFDDRPEVMELYNKAWDRIKAVK